MKYCIALLLCTLALTSFAQTKSINTSPPLKEGSASSVGISDERLARIDAMCNQALEENL
jgi:hypothetical protein